MNGTSKRRIAAGAVVVLAVAGGGAAIAATQSSSPKQETHAVVDDAAQQLGIAPAKLSEALTKALSNRVDAAVADRRLTEAQGKELKTRIASGEYPLFAGPRGFRHERPGPFGRGHLRARPGLDAAASYLGLSAAELRTQLEDGKTLAGVAKATGRSVDGLVDAMFTLAKKRLDEAVGAGRLTAAQRDEMVARLRRHVTAMVNGELPLGRDGRGGFGRGHFGVRAGLDAAASYLGLTEAQLRTQLEAGKTLADVAKARGKSVDGLVDAQVAAAKKRLDATVAAGRLTGAQRDELAARLREHVTAAVNGQMPLHHRGFGFGGSGSGSASPKRGRDSDGGGASLWSAA